MQERVDRYSAVSIALHWTIAALILANVIVGGNMEEASGEGRLFWFDWHKSIGLTILALSLFRLGWRLRHPWPPLPSMPGWQRVLARGTHSLFYVVMIGAPLLGWAAASAHGAPELPLYGLIPVPNLPLPEAAGEGLGEAHKLVVKSIYVLVALHVAGALKHHFLGKDAVLHRMLPVVPKPKG